MGSYELIKMQGKNNWYMIVRMTREFNFMRKINL